MSPTKQKYIGGVGAFYMIEVYKIDPTTESKELVFGWKINEVSDRDARQRARELLQQEENLKVFGDESELEIIISRESSVGKSEILLKDFVKEFLKKKD